MLEGDDERAVDLDDVDRQEREVAQRGVADPEVVDRDPHAEVTQSLDGRLGDLDLEERRLRDLDHQALRSQAAGFEALAEAGDDVRADELARGQVDADPRTADRRAPVSGGPARLVDDPVRQRGDEPARLGDRDELAGRDEPSVAHPANERLVADRLAGREVDDRLVVEPEVAGGDPGGEIGAELELRVRGLVHGRLVDLHAALAVTLGEVHRDVGVAHEFVSGLVVGRGHGHADAGVRDELVPRDVERFAERRQHALGDADRDERVRACRQGDDELVAAEAGRHVAVADRPPESLADRDQEAVAGLVAVGVVDGLEVVEVDEQDRQQAVVGSVGEVRCQPLGEETAVGQ